MTHEDSIHTIERVLDEIRPNIQMDGGDIELVKFEDGIVYVKLLGACIECPASMYTLKMGIEERLKEHMSDVTEVVAVDE